MKEYKLKELLSVGEVSKILGVCVKTIHRWDKEGKLKSFHRTFGNHRRFKRTDVFRLLYQKENTQIIGYARVSSYDQKKDLKTQVNRLKKFNSKMEVIEDLGSGLNYKKRGLKKLLNLIFNQQISTLVLSHKDRLLRFGSELIFKLCHHFNIHVICLDDKVDIPFEEELTNDVIELMTVFSARLYGKRSHKNKKIMNNKITT